MGPRIPAVTLRTAALNPDSQLGELVQITEFSKLILFRLKNKDNIYTFSGLGED